MLDLHAFGNFVSNLEEFEYRGNYLEGLSTYMTKAYWEFMECVREDFAAEINSKHHLVRRIHDGDDMRQESGSMWYRGLNWIVSLSLRLHRLWLEL
jgi:hypothetical protein